MTRTALLFLLCCGTLAAQPAALPQVLYGASYYHEYMPTERLERDVELMKQSGINVVRMGESTWSLWEPRDGVFEYEWMDRVVNAMAKAGIKVILGTPTYSLPTWLYKAHPEILARKLGGGESHYGMRQNMDISHPVYRRYCERVIVNLVRHYRDNPAVIGWQVDNETGSYGAANEDVFEGFREHLKEKFGTVERLNQAWLLNYWGQNLASWDELPSRDAATSTGYKLEWTRWQQRRVTDFLAWQAELVRKNRRADQFVTQDFVGSPRRDVNEYRVAQAMDVVAANPYHGTQEHMDGYAQAYAGDYFRSLKHANYLVTETNAQTTGWNSAYQYPPYDGQFRLDVYTHLSSGANMVGYWHWHSIHSGQETYWKGVLSHDLEPNRAYREVQRTAGELRRIGQSLVNLKIENRVAILYSVDSANAIDFMPFTSSGPQWSGAGPTADYMSVLQQFHRVLYRMNVGVDFVFPEEADFSRYQLLIVPALYISDDALLKKINAFVQAGGKAVITFKSGFCDENSRVRVMRGPGPLREVAGVGYQEFSNLEKPVALKGDPFVAGAENKAQHWAEFLEYDAKGRATAWAEYEHPFFGRWPAVTSNQAGKGQAVYEGTFLSDENQAGLLKRLLGPVLGPDQALAPGLHVKHGTNGLGRKVHYYLNYTGASQQFQYPYGGGIELLSSKMVAKGQAFEVPAWDLVIVEER